ncbi:hypothetical protein Nepgr_032357 [Nepenthes gracilis]|uniref:Uncharacterized protein n=1 Tax=Nepenthes gracilis TaxID=150966 RepID=A0AAD3TJY2_NEPGR|nr:hypothetical protein Nepgr_032357 [Nepenthes gracilis]
MAADEMYKKRKLRREIWRRRGEGEFSKGRKKTKLLPMVEDTQKNIEDDPVEVAAAVVEAEMGTDVEVATGAMEQRNC